MSTNPTDSSLQLPVGCGQRLRAAREAAGLTIDDVAARLHMPSRVVKSLETEDWARLGAPVFVRGQVRSYSRLLGLMTAPMMEALDVGPVEPSRLVSRTHTTKAQWWAEQIGRRLIYILLTLSLAIPAWIATREHLSGEVRDAAPLDMPVGTAPAGDAAAPRTMVASMAPVAKLAEPSVQGDDIVVRARAETWFEAVGADGKVLERGLLPAGSVRRYAHAQLSRFTIGNAASADVVARGREVPMAELSRANVARFAVSSDGSLVASD